MIRFSATEKEKGCETKQTKLIFYRSTGFSLCALKDVIYEGDIFSNLKNSRFFIPQKKYNLIMIKKHSVFICIVISVILLVIAALVYPGGSLADKNSIGFDWSKNFISNLFTAKAMNGSENSSRIWAIIGMAFHSVGYGIFFINMSKKIPDKQAVYVLKYIGMANIVFNFLIATPLHDIMIIISSTLSLLGLFYITVFILKTKLHLFKFFCIICLITFYFTLYLYGAGDWGLLAIMQKVSLICSMLLVLGIEYFTKKENFQLIK